MTDTDLKLFEEQERPGTYDSRITIENPESPISIYLDMLTMPLDMTSVLMALVMLVLTYLTVHLVLILAAYLVWPITIAVFVLLLLPMIRDGTAQSAMPSLTNFFDSLSQKTSSIAVNLNDYCVEFRNSFSGRGDFFKQRKMNDVTDPACQADNSATVNRDEDVKRTMPIK